MSLGNSSPSSRKSHCDPMDYDDELIELHEYSRSKERGLIHPDNSDEDTEDASEDGDSRRHNFEEVPENIKEQVYREKLNFLKSQLAALEAETHPEYKRKLAKIERNLKERKKLNDAWRDYEVECIDRDYMKEKKAALREFEDKKIELRENVTIVLEDKRKNTLLERYTLELTIDASETKPISKRTLRRRPNEPIPLSEKRRKTPQSQITFLLEERDVEDDLKIILKGKFMPSKKSKGGMGSMNLNSNSIDETIRTLNFSLGAHSSGLFFNTDAKIEDGKLFYEKKWFHRGQPVYLESAKDQQKISGVISGINQDTVWVRKTIDQTRLKVPLAHLLKGKYSITRRA